MAIKKLVSHSSQSTRFLVHSKNALMSFVEKNNVICLFIENTNLNEIKKLKKFKNISHLKFVGSEEIFKLIDNLKLSWPPFEKKIFQKDEVEALFYSKDGKIRIEKPKHASVTAQLFSSKNEEKKTSSETSVKKVLVVDDSKTIQKLLSTIISKSNKLELMGIASCPSEARKLIEKEIPDLITLDIHMPEMNGVEFLKSYIQPKKIPTIMISSVSMNEGPLVMEALSSGAQTYIQKPSIDELDEVSIDILNKLELISECKAEQQYSFSSMKTKFQFNSTEGLIVIGSSTGGTQALQEIFTSLPSEIPPILVVQHIPSVFSKALAERLNTLCPFTVKEAEDGEFIKRNTIYIAPGDQQMKLLKRGSEKRIAITDDPPVNRFKPSVDYLFHSVAKVEEPDLMGIVLTGMGRDGAQGLLELKNIGAYTIAQDEASSVVFGMPKEAISLGAAEKIVPLYEMAEKMVLQFNKHKQRKEVA